MGPAPLAGDVTGNLPVITWKRRSRGCWRRARNWPKPAPPCNRAACDLALHCAERIPNFEAGAAVKKDTGTGFTVVDVGIGVPLPVFNRNQGNIVRAQAALASARTEIRRLELELRERLATAFEQYVGARRRAETYAGSILPSARRSLELTTTGYREGEFAYLTLLTAQRTYYDTTLNYLVSLEEVWGRSVELEGMLLRGGLQGASGD